MSDSLPRRNQLDVLEDIAASTATLADGGGGGGTGGPDREVVTETYRANKVFTGASLNDLITSVRVVDVSGTDPAIVGDTLWYNETTRAVLASAPLAADIDLAGGGGGATNGELVAALATQSGVKITAAAALAAGGTGLIGWLSSMVHVFGDRSNGASSNPTNTDPLISNIKGIFSSLGSITGTGATSPVGSNPINSILKGLWQHFVDRSDATAFNVTTVKQPLVSRQLAAGAASAATQLTAATRRISIYARTADIRYLIGSATGTALATSHFIAAGERLDLAVPATPWIMVLRDGSTDGVLELSELT